MATPSDEAKCSVPTGQERVPALVAGTHDGIDVVCPDSAAHSIRVERNGVDESKVDIEARRKTRRGIGQVVDAIPESARTELQPQSIPGGLGEVVRAGGDVVHARCRLGMAVLHDRLGHYLSSQWNKLIRFIEDASYLLDNNVCENTIRPFCVGRRNWLFADTMAGANASANLYSLLQTCPVNGIDGYQYLRALLTALPTATTAEDFEALLPWRIALKSDCRIKPFASPTSPQGRGQLTAYRAA